MASMCKDVLRNLHFVDFEDDNRVMELNCELNC